MADNQQKTCSESRGLYLLLLFFLRESKDMTRIITTDKHPLSEGHKLKLQEKITKGAKNFEKYLNNKCFKIVCEDGTETVVRFFQSDFKHLTGIESDLDDNDFYNKCLNDHISTGNILTDQKYDWSTLKGKSNRIEFLHNLLYEDAEKTLLLNELKVKTTVFPVAIRNDGSKSCVGFVSNINKARSLRKSNSSKDVLSEKNIVAVYGKKNGEQEFSEVVYQKNT